MHMYSHVAARPPIPPMNERDLAVLRVLCRMGTVQGTTLHTLLTPELHVSTSRRLWQRLTKRKLIWQARIQHKKTDAAGRASCTWSHVYGLTDEGWGLIERLGVEPDETFAHLIYWPKPSAAPRTAQSLVYETSISDWCASLLDQVRRTPMLAGVHVQRRYAMTDANGATVQTLGAAIVLAFDLQQTRFDRPCLTIPWLGMGLPDARWTVVRLALEVDTGRPALASYATMAQCYAQTSGRDGLWTDPLDGPYMPVLITPPGRRLRSVAEAWIDAWPLSPAILSSTAKTLHVDYGVLWGQYLSLTTNPLQPTNLLGDLLGTVDQWPARTSGWQTRKLH